MEHQNNIPGNMFTTVSHNIAQGCAQENSNEASMNVYRICCCCLELVCLKSLWSKYSWMGRTEVYGNMLNECFNLSWSQSDNSGEQICEVCITQLRNAIQFKKKILQSQAAIASQLIDITRPVKDEDSRLDVDMKKSGYEDITSIEAVTECCVNDVFEEESPASDDFNDFESSDKHAVKRKNTGTQKGTRKKYAKREKVDRRTVNYVKPRQNVCLILEHSTILPFKSNKGYFNCLYCNKQFIGIDELKTHVSVVHENISFKSILKSILRPHDRIRADVSDITCRICKKKLDNLEILIKHLTDHGVNFNFDEKKPSDCILAYNLGGGKYKCAVCQDEFLFFKTLSKHMNEHSTDYVCDVCGRCFLLPERLRAHSQMHIGGKSVKCEYCGKICGSNILLKSHIRYTHKKLSFMCSICNQTFSSYRLRMKHLEEIHNRTPLNLNCKLCTKKFLTPNSLNNHIRTDHLKVPKEPKYGCNLCGIMFKTKHALSYHSIVHTGEKNHECDVCHKKYARAKTLTEHIKIHLNDRRWSCAVCRQAFVQKCSLKNHIRVHHVDMELEQLIVYKKPDDK